MQNDKTTLKDLSIFTADGTGGVFPLIDRTITQMGRDVLRRIMYHPPDSFEQLLDTQQVVRFWSLHLNLWTDAISNGTLVMLEKFFESADTAGAPPAGFSMVVNSLIQKLFNRRQYFFIQFSISHLADFFKGCRQLCLVANHEGVPRLLHAELQLMSKELEHRLTERVMAVHKATPFAELAELNYLVRREMKGMVGRLMASYARLDAWQAMARATVQLGWTFPELLPAHPIVYQVQQLAHPLLPTPVPYTMDMQDSRNFLLLTGANMSGKTTFMRALGVGALLAHTGMGVPAQAMRISFMDGIVTNMHVEDDLLKGESYFFAEVQRMKQTAEKLLGNKPYLVLMDELFKGTNVHDAYECTRGVIQGLLRHRRHLMVLSTHLYEVAHHYNDENGILFYYFVTRLSEDGSYHFTYQLQQGISNDRIGYRILQKEGVIDLLMKANNETIQ
jgi:DNA mismatch repair ATPase MutS